MAEDLLQYDKLVETALKGVVRSALEVASQHGLHGAHHFYITFRTQATGVVVPPYLREQYPDDMTIVLQYQFYNLRVTQEYFSVSLSFNNVQEDLHIPFAAVVGFADPAVKFGLQFNVEEIADIEAVPLVGSKEETPTDPTPPNGGASGGQDNVVKLDTFRKK